MPELTLALVLFVAAVAFFIVGAAGKWARAVPVGLACFAGAFIAQALPK